MNDKEKDEAELCLKVKADSGYEAEQKQRINVRQYSDICRILNGEKLPAATAKSEASEGRDALLPVPLSEIWQILAWGMETAVSNGANSISMPDQYVAVAHFLAAPEKYDLAWHKKISQKGESDEQGWTAGIAE